MQEEKKQIHIQVKDKIATFVSMNFTLVGGNSDYEVVFDFDSEWAKYPVKTALFIYADETKKVVIDGNTCKGIPIEKATICLIGAFAGDIYTTTPACIRDIKLSIRDMATSLPEPPTEDVYNQIMELLNRYINEASGIPSGGAKGQVLKKASDNDYDATWQDDEKGTQISEADILRVVKEYIEQNPPQDGFSPTVDIIPVDNGYTVNITDKNDVHSYTLYNGLNGKSAYEYAKEGGYTGTEVDFSQKLAKEIPTKVSDLENDKNFIDATGAPVQSVNDKTGNINLSASDVGARPSTWTPTAEEVGADKKGTASSLVSIHNTDSESHNDIRLLIEGLNSRLNALANSEDVDLDQMKELVDYIKANRGLIEQITTNKVNYTDIIDNLTTNVKNKPLSAAQGVALKALIDVLTTGKLDATELTNAINTALAQAKASGKFDGADGVSPKITLSKSGKIVTIYTEDAFGADRQEISDGEDGKTPYIQDGYWYIDGVNTNVKAEGKDGKTAYAYAQEAGFTGTEAQFSAKLAAPFVTPQMFGAKGDGVNDDTAAIQAALNDSCGYVYIPDGTYMIDADNDKSAGIKPNSNQTIILSKKATLKAITTSNDHYSIININDVDNVYICGGKVEGEKDTHTGTGGEWGTGVFINSGENITIEDVEISGCWGDAIWLHYPSTATPSKNVKVLNCVLHDCRRQGISVVGGEDVTIRDCEIYNIRGIAPQYGIDIEPDGSVRHAINITIDNCYIHDNGVGSIVVAGVTNEIRNVNIVNCTLEDINFQGAITDGVFTGGKECKVSNCKIGRVDFFNPNTVRVSNSILGKVNLCGGVAILNDCDIINNGSLVGSSNDRISTQKANLYCYNCRFVSSDVSSSAYLLPVGNGNETYGLPDEVLSFANCTFELGANVYLMARAGGKETIFDGCLIKYKWAVPYGLFIIAQGLSGVENNIIIRNTRVECDSTCRAVFNVDGNKIASFDVANCSFPTTTNLLSVAIGATGNLKLFKSDISTTTLSGSGTKTASIINSFVTEIPSEYVTETELNNKGYLTSIPSEYVTDTELTNKGYLTLNTLPKYNGGVS